MLSNTIGKALAAACHADYMIDGRVDSDDFGPLQLEFADQTVLVFSVSAAGQGVEIDTVPLVFHERRDDFDAWKRLQLADGKWTPLLSARITAIDEWIWGNDVTVGWRLWFDNNWLCYWNAGDDAKCGVDEIPTWPGGDCSWRSLSAMLKSR